MIFSANMTFSAQGLVHLEEKVNIKRKLLAITINMILYIDHTLKRHCYAIQLYTKSISCTLMPFFQDRKELAIRMQQVLMHTMVT